VEGLRLGAESTYHKYELTFQFVFLGALFPRQLSFWSAEVVALSHSVDPHYRLGLAEHGGLKEWLGVWNSRP